MQWLMQIHRTWETSVHNSSAVFFIFLNIVLLFLSLACNIYAGEKQVSSYYGLYWLFIIAYLIILELQQQTVQDDTLHIQWIIQIFCISWTSIDNSSVGFLDFSKQSFGFSLIQLNEELAPACNTYVGEQYIYCSYDGYVLYLIDYLIILKLPTINPLV